MKKLPIGIQDFKYMIENDYLYIDKTQYLFDLKNKGKFYFMSRPRRFGKSLTVSTYNYLFKGEKELFKGTWIYDKWDFEARPVIRFSMSNLDSRDEDSLEKTLFETVEEIYETYGLKSDTDMLKTSFRRLIEALYEKYKKRVIVLIDEYDKPILNHLHEPELAKKIRGVLRLFYSTLKDADPYLDFVFLTGITKFTKAGVFSTLNNLQDISIKGSCSQMLGYTEDELKNGFEDYVKRGLKQKKVDKETFFKEIKDQYNGFSFDGEHFVYNPFSILNYFDEYKLKNYWVESGSPAFIVEYAKSHDIKPDVLLGSYIDDAILTTYEIESAPPVSFLIQAGYLTFKAYDEFYGYLIDYPNKEVRDSFSQLLMVSEYNMNSDDTNEIRKLIKEGLREKNFDKIFEQMKRTLSNIPYTLFEPRRKTESEESYTIRREGFYHSIILTMFWAAGITIKAEEITALGRSDLILEFETEVYIMELKKQPPEISLQQIKEKNYAGKYSGNIRYIGIEIDDEQRNFSRYLME